MIVPLFYYRMSKIHVINEDICMLHKYIIAAMCILMNIPIYAMKHNTLRLIKKWEDVQPFAGKVVAYKTTSYYINSIKDDYQSHNSIFNYGFIERTPIYWSCGEMGYNMNKLLKKKGYPGNMALTKREILHKPFRMREVNSREAKEIIKAITRKKARFAYTWGERKQEIISDLKLIVQQKNGE
jgi:hypothetical protein